MSAILLGQVLNLPLPSSENSYLVTLANAANDDGDGCFPGYKTIEYQSGLSRASISKFSKAFEIMGWLTVTKRGGNGTGRKTNLYQINLPRVPNSWREIPSEVINEIQERLALAKQFVDFISSNKVELELDKVKKVYQITLKKELNIDWQSSLVNYPEFINELAKFTSKPRLSSPVNQAEFTSEPPEFTSEPKTKVLNIRNRNLSIIDNPDFTFCFEKPVELEADWLDHKSFKDKYKQLMQAKGLQATKERWQIMQSTFIDFWCNGEARGKKKDWLLTFSNHLNHNIETHQWKWRKEQESMQSNGFDNYPELSNTQSENTAEDQKSANKMLYEQMIAFGMQEEAEKFKKKFIDPA